MKNKVLWRMTATVMAALVAFEASVVTARASDVGQAIEVPAEVQEISEELGSRYNICPELIQAVCFKESSFRPDAVNGDCVGIMQVSERWHKGRMERLGVTGLTDIRENMSVGVDYLAELFAEYEDAGAALMKYSGNSRLSNLVDGTGDFSDYADEVLALSAELERRNGK